MPVMANPPFAGDIKESRILAKYDLGKKILLEKLTKDKVPVKNLLDLSDQNPGFPEFLGISGEKVIKLADGTFRRIKVKSASKMGRDILFIERNLSFLKPGGRMAIVLPQGRFNNSSDKYIREYIADRCRILSVVGLHGNVFKPHTGTKTSVMFLQKWNDDPKAGPLCPRLDDYPIFFATMQEPSKDNSGDKIYIRKKDFPQFQVKPEKTEPVQSELNLATEQSFYLDSPKEFDDYLLDEHDHLVVKHDLFAHDLKSGLRTSDGIAEAFAEFAKKEGLSFF